MKRNSKIAIFLMSSTVFLGGCTTITMKIPDFDSIKLPEFREDAENIGDYQDWASAPQTPNDLPSAESWDVSAKKIMAERDALQIPVSGNETKSNEDIAEDMKTLGEKAREYKLDDPQ